MSEGTKGKTPHGEVSIDQLAQIQPGMSKIMQEVSTRFYYTFYAAKGGNWRLAAHELNGVRTAFRVAKVTRPKFSGDLEAFDAEYLLPIFKAIRDKDWPGFEEVYLKAVEGSDKYHDKTGHEYIRFMLPPEPPTDLYLGPMDRFKRTSWQRPR